MALETKYIEWLDVTRTIHASLDVPPPLYLLGAVSWGKKVETKIRKKPLRKGIREIVKKTYKKSEFRGKEDIVGKESPGFPNL